MNRSVKCQSVYRGILYVVATPIGNLGDITLRALKTLGSVDLVAAEDTRRSRKLLSHHGIRKPLISYYSAREKSRGREILKRLKSGEKVALVCDGGTPGISDPGYRLIRECIQEGIPVIPIPGPSAIMAVLSASGLPVNKFQFFGFLSNKRGRRRRQLREIRDYRGMLVFYESPRRILPFLEDVQEELGDLPACLGREVTKINEEFIRGKVGEIIENLSGLEIRGEFTLVVDNKRSGESRGKG